jgi:hypothetical protein
MKTGLDDTVPSKTSPETQNKKTGSDALGIAENESGLEKHVNGTRWPRHAKMSPGSQNMKTGPDAHGNAENDSGAQNMKTGPDAVRTAKNDYGGAK